MTRVGYGALREVGCDVASQVEGVARWMVDGPYLDLRIAFQSRLGTRWEITAPARFGRKLACVGRPAARKGRIEHFPCVVLTTFPIEKQKHRVAGFVALIKPQVTEMLLTMYTKPQEDVPVKSRQNRIPALKIGRRCRSREATGSVLVSRRRMTSSMGRAIASRGKSRGVGGELRGFPARMKNCIKTKEEGSRAS